MALRRKTLLIVGVAVVALMAIIYVTSSAIFLGGFAVLEEQDTRENARRVMDAFTENVNKIDFTTADWAGWGDTYTYIVDGNQRYVKENLNDAAIGPKGIAMNVVLYIQLSGVVRYGTGYDLAKDVRTPLPENLKRHLSPTSVLLRHPTIESSVSGILLLPEGPLLVASRPILNDQKQGPIRGTLIFGRYFNDAAIRRLTDITHFSLTVRRFNDTLLPSDFQAVRAAYTGAEKIFVQPLSPTTIAGYTVLRGIHGEPALIFRVDTPRTIYRQGHVTARNFLIALLGVGALLGGATLFLFDRLILNQLARQASEERFRDLFENANDIVFTTDLEWNIRSVNRAGEQLTGYTREEAHQMTIARVVAPEYIDMAWQMLSGKMAPGGSTTYEIELVTKDGRRVPVEVGARLTYQEGKPVGVQGIARDITERKRAEAALRESEERYALAARGANDGLWDWNLGTNQVYFSPRWKAMVGCAEEEIGDSPDDWFNRVHSDDVQHLRTQIAAHLEGQAPHFECEYRIWHKDGDYRWMLSRGLAVRDTGGKAHRIAGSQTDITERKVAEQQLLHDALHDGLTDLPNRALFMDRLEQAIRREKRRPDYKFAVLFLDVDRFKVINDSLGHAEGDQLLRGVGLRLGMSLRPGDSVARLGGDEFAILLDEIKHTDDAAVVAGRILRTLALPFNLGGHEVVVTASIGIAPSAKEYQRPEEYLRDADTAMYRAKDLGKARYIIFSPEMHVRAMAQLELESDLRRAIDLKEFHLHYQPIVSLETGRVVGLEALARWNHPQRGPISPGEFIPAAEETGLIVPIGLWVLREACRQARVWHVELPAAQPPFISVNISARQLAQSDLAAQIGQILSETGLDPRLLDLEITESTIMEDIEQASTMLAQLRALNLRVAVDDFGTGYSSLGALRRFPINALKIDRSFVHRMHTSDEDEEVVRAIITLAHNLNMEVVAEGVEAIDQLAALKALDCEYAQGFFFSKPVDLTAATGLLERQPNWESALRVVAATPAV